MKFSIIMPTYNDADSIEESLESIINQNYDNWELLISDDGSTDNTKSVIDKVIKKHKEKNIKYFFQQNQDQLNAILNVTDKITGDYVYILHSDDLFYNNYVLSKANDYLKDNNVEAIISNPAIIDKDSNIVGMHSVNEYKISEDTLALQLLWLGRNLYIDMAFYRIDIFKTKVKENYLTWNMPFWLSNNNQTVCMLNIKKVDFHFFKYRVFEGNYINNMLGQLNVINGELRTAYGLMEYYDIPFYKLQYTAYRIFNKLKLLKYYKLIYFNKKTKNKYKILKFIIQKRFNNEYKKNLYLNNLLEFYRSKNNRKIIIDKINPNDFIYYGKDMRKFNNDLLNNKLSKLYQKLIKEMEFGFNEIEVKTNNDKEIINVALKFLCLNNDVKVIVKNK